MRAGFHQSALLQNCDPVGVLYRAQSVGHNYHRAPLEELTQVLDDDPLVVCVEGVGGLVEKEILRVLVDRPCDEDALLLSLAEPLALRSDLCVVAHGQSLHILPQVGHLHRTPEFPLVDILVRRGDVACDGVGKNEPVLHDHPACPPPRAVADEGKAFLAQTYFSFGWFVVLQEHFDQGGFAAAAGAHDGRHLARRQLQAHFPQGVLFESSRILECEVMDGQPGFGGEGPLHPLVVLLFLVGAVVDFSQTLHADARVLRGMDEGDDARDRAVELADDVLHSHHHPEGHLPVDHCGGRGNG